MKYKNFPAIATVNPWSSESIGPRYVNEGGIVANSISSIAYPTGNLAIFIPFFVPSPVIARWFFCYNGAVIAGNVDIGIYGVDGAKIVSTGSILQSGTSNLQPFYLSTPIEFGPGLFRLAIAHNNVTGTFQAGNTSGSLSMYSALGITQQANAFPLPNNFVLVAATKDYIPMFGFSTRGII